MLLRLYYTTNDALYQIVNTNRSLKEQYVCPSSSTSLWVVISSFFKSLWHVSPMLPDPV